ncbi:MAG: hypothetical protein IJC66_09725 [Kiritimatiellae bacterium]|nr:hypothetical protein [Kiritimatiellia bacterium]
MFVPDHLAAGGFVGLTIGIGEVELDEPVIVDALCQRLQFRDLFAVQFNLLVDTSENARYAEV